MDSQSFSKIWIIIIVIVLLAGGILAWQYFGVSKEEVRAPEEVPEKKEVIEAETTNWKTYRSEEYGFEFKYPPYVISITEEKEKWGREFMVTLIRSFPFEYEDFDPCDIKEIFVSVFDGGLEEITIGMDGTPLKDEPNTEEIKIGLLKGYRIIGGSDACIGHSYYFFLTPAKTLSIKRNFINLKYLEEEGFPDLKIKKYSAFQNFISSNEEEKLFNQMLSTFRFLE